MQALFIVSPLYEPTHHPVPGITWRPEGAAGDWHDAQNGKHSLGQILKMYGSRRESQKCKKNDPR